MSWDGFLKKDRAKEYCSACFSITIDLKVFWQIDLTSCIDVQTFDIHLLSQVQTTIMVFYDILHYSC